ncbi:Rne/Rng family ribonuclease [Pelobacter seleniigenes]|uniref:Rne/Rng family ribonuclease n=1 Tax=Pelobacter seleniigenes TaxID=407188 RepID=UPI0007AEE925|nr:ribonuclease E/G [Pelobacter seleniigenes]
MSKKMLINASHPEENRVAIVVDGILSDLDIELAGQEQSKGNIYKAVVVRVETGLQAAFVDYGAEKLGFLQIGEIHPNLYPTREDSKHRPRIADILKRGQEILVQIVKEERGSKGAALTTFLSIPGRYMVLMPDSTTKGVSRKIAEDSERKKLKKTMAELDLPERMGYIVRTAGIGKDKEELKRDFDYLVRLFEGITARKDQIKAPAQLYQESNLAIRSIRDYFSTDMDEVLIDDQTVFRDARDFFALVMPELGNLVKQHRERRPIFSRYQIEEQIDGLAKNQIPLPSGGSIVIDQTEALVAIDVNSGKMASESGIEATALKTNLEAAAEVGRQLRLRDLGGLIVIDFIDMRDRKNIREVEQELRKALKDDKAKVSVGRISQFGLLEMSRQRLKPVLSVGSFIECPHCKGIGKVKSVEAQSVALLRQIHTAASKGQIALIEAEVPMDVANYLLNRKRATINELEQQLGMRIAILGSSTLLPGEIEIELRKKDKEPDDSKDIAPISHANQIEVALAAQQDEMRNQAQEEELEEDSPAPQESAEESVNSEAPKKKRRRRRRKSSAAKTNQEQQTSQPPAAQETATDSATPAEAETAQPQATELPVAAQADSQPQPEQSSPTREATSPAPAAGESKPTTEPAAAEKKPRRRTRRPTKKTTGAQSTPVGPVEPVASAAVAEKPAPAVESQPVASAPVVAQQPEPVPTNTETAPVTPAEPAETPATAKPKRRPRKPRAKKPVEQATGETAQQQKTAEPAENPTKPVESPQTEPPVSEKPQRRTQRSTAKPAAQKTSGEAQQATQPAPAKADPAPASSVVEQSPQAEAEKPPRRTRRAAPKAKSDSEPAAAAADAEKKTPRRTRKKATPATDQEAGSSASGEAASGEESKPKRAPRRAPRKKVSSDTDVKPVTE